MGLSGADFIVGLDGEIEPPVDIAQAFQVVGIVLVATGVVADPKVQAERL